MNEMILFSKTRLEVLVASPGWDSYEDMVM